MLKNFKLVRTEGLKGLMLKGRLIPFEKIDDTLAETLIGKTHVLERISVEQPVATTVTVAVSESTAAEVGAKSKAK